MDIECKNGERGTVRCNHCGKPIVEFTKLGVFCEDRCGYEGSKEAKEQIDNVISKVLELFQED